MHPVQLRKKHWIILCLIFVVGILVGYGVPGLHPQNPAKAPVNETGVSPANETGLSHAERAGFNNIVLAVNLPESPSSVPVYRIRSIDTLEEGDPAKAFTEKKNVPSAREAPAAAARALEKYGGLPSDARLDMVFPRAMHEVKEDGSDREIYSEGTQISYMQEINGSPVIGGGINLELGVNGEIFNILKEWPIYEIYDGSVVKIIPARTAYEKLRNGEVMNGKIQGQIHEGTKVTEFRQGYLVAGGPGSYLKPVWVFAITEHITSEDERPFLQWVDATA